MSETTHKGGAAIRESAPSTGAADHAAPVREAATPQERAIARAQAEWRRRYDETVRERDLLLDTISGGRVEPVYGPADAADRDYLEQVGLPGEYPYTRGIHPSMYRTRLWTMRQFAGFGSAKQTNERFHYLISHGQDGLSVAFDVPTLMGFDSDEAKARGEVGVCGVAVDSLADMEVLFRGIPLDKITTSMTINGPAAILWALFLAAAEKQGVPFDKLGGTLQNDCFKEFIAQKCWCFPPRPALRLVVNAIEYATQHLPKWNSVSVSGYHIREAGATAAQELAFTLKDGFTYLEEALKTGLDVDEFAPRLSFFFNAHIDFFEEIAKYRAARRIWARHLREVYGAKSPKSWQLRFHTQTAGCSLTAQQPENNIVRTAIEALAGVLGGTQSLHTNSMDETWALPSDKAVKIALRTQQIIAYETGVTNVADPLGGSYYLEALTDRLEREAEEYFREIDARGGVVTCIEQGYFQREIHRASYRYQQEVEQKKRIIVGVNEFVEDEEKIEIPILYIDPQVERDQVVALQLLRETRDNDLVARRLSALTEASRDESKNLMPLLVDCARAYATKGEMRRAMGAVFGEHHEAPEF
jgi:methylmalonyl-CoA mutase N-terminal domain/subunit